MECQKHLFNLGDDVCYLNGAYMSPLLKSVEEAGIEGILMKRDPSKFQVEHFFEPQIHLKTKFSQLIGSNEPERIAIIPSVSYGLANVTNNLKAKAGQKIIIAGEQFPSNYYPWKKVADEKDLILSIITPSASDTTRGEKWNDMLEEAIDSDTVAVSLSHVHWADGSLFDLKRVREKLNRVGGILVVDGTQSIGALPFNQSEIEADAIICAGYKWLMGPYSIGLAYMGPYFDKGKPVEESWINRIKSDDFANLSEYQHEYRSKAKRYDIGESSNFILIPMMKAAIEQLLNWDPFQYQAYCKRITEPTIQNLRSKGFWIDELPYRASHLFGIRFSKKMDMKFVKRVMDEKKIKVSIRGNAIRVSPGVYNTQEDLQKLADVLIGEFT